MASSLAYEKHWADKSNLDGAEKKYYEYLAQAVVPVIQPKPAAVSNKREQAPTKAVVPPAAAISEADQNKAKKDKRKNKKNKKDASQSPDPASSSSVSESVKVHPEAITRHNTDSALDDASKDQSKKKMSSFPAQCTLASEISKARQHIKNSLERMDGIAALAASPGAELLDRLSTVEKENDKLRSVIDGLNNLVIDLHARVKALESGAAAPATKSAATSAPAPVADDDEDDDDVDLFGSEDEDEDKAAAELREKRLAEYAAKKSKKPALIAKSNVILDIKPWDDETDMKQMEAEVRKITMDGLLLGASKLVPLAYGIHKLQLSCVIEDDKVSVDELQEKIELIEDYVQSVDIAAFNKI
ncbi:probable elongation factor 1-delta isoform X3 [Armigeres subalbatus]|uniref:probable elongation factor 1-delta isoform X3 n=1 Tax=Armigeres subalbatus TaxID=124917 RepID=UPI002ED4F32F